MKQLILIADMEGASGIFEGCHKWLWNGHDDWRKYGRDCITSDVLAVCSAAIDFGIDDILLYDMHWAGNAEFNIIIEKLLPIVRVFDVPNRQTLWRRMRGQAAQNPFGLITLGQHARFTDDPITNYCTASAYFPHTIQSPPIKNFFLNDLHIAEIGTAVLSFRDVPYLANIGCQASMQEARELSESVIMVPVKDKAKGWEPSPAETYPLIYQGTMKALVRAREAKAVNIESPLGFSMELCDGFVLETDTKTSWKGSVGPKKAEWTAPCIEIGLELFNDVRALIKREDDMNRGNQNVL